MLVEKLNSFRISSGTGCDTKSVVIDKTFVMLSYFNDTTKSKLDFYQMSDGCLISEIKTPEIDIEFLEDEIEIWTIGEDDGIRYPYSIETANKINELLK